MGRDLHERFVRFHKKIRREMIPKKIHYCWLSGDPFPELIAKCISGWSEKLPDYEFVLWDANRFNIQNNLWVKQAFEAKKYAFAADFIRLYAVYTQGGIYLDTDIEVVKPFDDLLRLPYFIGSEGHSNIEAGIFGAEAGQTWLGDCLKYYDNREFIKPDGTFDILTLPRIMNQQIEQNREIVEASKTEIFASDLRDESKLFIFPKDFFCAKDHGTGIVEKTENTYAIHHFAMSWVGAKTTFLPNLKRKLMAVFGVGFVSSVITVLGLKAIRDAIAKKKAP
ncbi:glycosyltransferase [Flavobacterium sp.]|uniref:glycosyltransferase family 32 protein n=1 Tax=Flavobacterium sp. TaxID=239 RepID=UPI0025B8BF7D|nr:glycosyltransferase [Flavobacterium sp.]